MSEPSTTRPQSGAADSRGANVPLDDVMIAMDVVDTLRHDERLIERELNDAARRKELIERLRQIYADQGIVVPDRILEEGVKALEEDRFVYTPPPDTIQTRLARIYVTRGRWGRWVIGAAIGLAAVLLAYQLLVAWPERRALEAARIEMTETIPAELQRLLADISTESRDSAVSERARELAQSGLNAAKAGDATTARSMREAMQQLLAELRSEYRIRIVNRRGELTGLWRTPPTNPDTYNYYLVVEAIGPDDQPIPQSILNEETGKRETVTTWAVRVSKEVLERVAADKRDDGIVQNAIVGRKERGRSEREWSIPVAGGYITRW